MLGLYAVDNSFPTQCRVVCIVRKGKDKINDRENRWNTRSNDRTDGRLGQMTERTDGTPGQMTERTDGRPGQMTEITDGTPGQTIERTDGTPGQMIEQMDTRTDDRGNKRKNRTDDRENRWNTRMDNRKIVETQNVERGGEREPCMKSVRFKGFEPMHTQILKPIYAAYVQQWRGTVGACCCFSHTHVTHPPSLSDNQGSNWGKRREEEEEEKEQPFNRMFFYKRCFIISKIICKVLFYNIQIICKVGKEMVLFMGFSSILLSGFSHSIWFGDTKKAC